MMSWLLISGNNTIAAGPVDEMPTPAEGQRVVEVALGCIWSVAKGAFVDALPTLTTLEFLMLWTPTEILAVMQTTSPDMAVAWALTIASPSIDLGNDLVTQGVALAVKLGILTDARAARILAGLPPK
jgi:hypothetical protein